MDNVATIALSRLTATERAVDVISGNIANAATPGFRAERVLFTDWLSPQRGTTVPRGDRTLAYTQDRATWREAAEGTIQHTGNPLDLALSGPGYFTVRTDAGTRLTRAGRFTLQNDGAITDEAGHALLDVNAQPIRIGPADAPLTVAADGALAGRGGPIARIAVVRPDDPAKLTAEGDRLMRADGPTQPVAQPHMIQGAVEDSNVQAVSELVRLMATTRNFQLATQMVEAEGERRQQAIDHIAAPV